MFHRVAELAFDDESTQAVTAKTRNKAARVSGRTPAAATLAIIIDLAIIPDGHNEMNAGDQYRQCLRLCRLITLDKVLSWDASPRTVVGTAPRELRCRHERWCTNRPEDSVDDIYSWSFDSAKKSTVQDSDHVDLEANFQHIVGQRRREEVRVHSFEELVINDGVHFRNYRITPIDVFSWGVLRLFWMSFEALIPDAVLHMPTMTIRGPTSR